MLIFFIILLIGIIAFFLIKHDIIVDVPEVLLALVFICGMVLIVAASCKDVVSKQRTLGTTHHEDSSRTSADNATDPEPHSFGSPVTQFSTVQINGKPYILVPKQSAEETTIAGQRYWVVPAP